MWENAYLSIKNPKASRALKWALDPGCKLLTSLARLRFPMSATFGLRTWAPPMTKSWICTTARQKSMAMCSVVSVFLFSVGDVIDQSEITWDPFALFPLPSPYIGTPHPLPWFRNHRGTPLHRGRLESRQLAFD